MSGIRVADAELIRLGLTLPGFVERSRTIASLPSLGLLTLAGMTPEEHQCTYIEVEDIRTLSRLPDQFDLVAISSYSAQMPEAYTLADGYGALGLPVVMGGLHVSALPEEALRHCNSVVVGEGEPAWRRIASDAQAGRLQSLYDGRGAFDFSAAPMPSFHLLDVGKYNRVTVPASRGCSWRCEFCASSILLTPAGGRTL